MSGYTLEEYSHLLMQLANESQRLYQKYVDLARWFTRESQSICEKLVVGTRQKKDLEYCARQIDAITELVLELVRQLYSNLDIVNMIFRFLDEKHRDKYPMYIPAYTSQDEFDILESLIFDVSTEAEQRRYECFRKDRNQSKESSGDLLNWLSEILECPPLYYEKNIKLIEKLEHNLALLEKLKNIAVMDKQKLNMYSAIFDTYECMNPTSTLNETLGSIQFEEDWSFTVGILVADYDQQLAREYILNYLDVFNKDSDKYIDFYIPGYVKTTGDTPFDFAIEDIKYKFDRDLFNKTIIQLRDLYGIKYSFCPLLILQECENGHFTERRIVIELNTEKAGLLFEEIFSIAKREVKIKEFSKELRRAQLKRILPQIIKDYIKKITGSPILEVVMDHTDTLIQYSITDKEEWFF